MAAGEVYGVDGVIRSTQRGVASLYAFCDSMRRTTSQAVAAAGDWGYPYPTGTDKFGRSCLPSAIRPGLLADVPPLPQESSSMTTMLSRRSFFQVTAAGLGASAVAHASALLAAEPWPNRKFTMALSCGMVGVRATPREAIELAHRYGFEAVEPSARFLAALSDDSLAQLLAEMKAKKLVWAAEGLPVEFRGGDKAFQDSINRLPDFAKGLKRAGVTRVGTWLNPSHNTLTYLANFRQHAAGSVRQPRFSVITACGSAWNTLAPRPLGPWVAFRSSTRWPK